MRNLMYLFTVLMILTVSGCYHMRIDPEPLPTETVVTSKSTETASRIIKRVLENELQVRILDERNNGSIMISAPRHFATETGFGQPAGGRQYYLQLQIDFIREQNRSYIRLSPFHYELRTSYAYGLEGQVRTLYKIYPYPEYPGMFDISYLENELKRIASLLEHALKDIQ